MGYNLLVKKQNWSDIYKRVNNISYKYFQAAIIEIKATNKCKDPDIIKLECQVQTITSQMPHSYARCLEYKFILKALSIGYNYLPLCITINLSNLRYPLVFELVGVLLSGATNQTAFKKMQNYMTTINPIAIAQFFHIIYIAIIDH